ncbi:hypothetical protein D3C76_931700 [compost metagenome]
MGLGHRGPGGEQLVVVGQGAVGNDEALLFTATGHVRQAHPFGCYVTFQAALHTTFDQPRLQTRQAQRRLGQPRALQGVDVFARNLWAVARAGEGLVVFEQRFVGVVGAGQGITQRQSTHRVCRFGGDHGLGAGDGFVGLTAIGLGQGQAELQVGILWIDHQGLTVQLLRRIPTLEVSIGASRSGQRLDRQRSMLALGLIDRHHLGVEAGPTGDLQVVADLRSAGLASRHLAQHGQRRRVMACTSVEHHLVIGGIGKRQHRPAQLAAQRDAKQRAQTTLNKRTHSTRHSSASLHGQPGRSAPLPIKQEAGSKESSQALMGLVLHSQAGHLQERHNSSESVQISALG